MRKSITSDFAVVLAESVVLPLYVSLLVALSFALLWGVEGRQSLPPALLSSPIPSC